MSWKHLSLRKHCDAHSKEKLEFLFEMIKYRSDRTQIENEDEKKKWLLNWTFYTWQSSSNLCLAICFPLYQCAACCKMRYFGERYLLCGRCSSVHYCSKECQTLHWKSHSSHCSNDLKADAMILHKFSDELGKTTNAMPVESLLMAIAARMELTHKQCQFSLSREQISTFLAKHTLPYNLNVTDWEIGSHSIDPPRVDNIIKVNIRLVENPRVSRSVAVYFNGNSKDVRVLQGMISPRGRVLRVIRSILILSFFLFLASGLIW